MASTSQQNLLTISKRMVTAQELLNENSSFLLTGPLNIVSFSATLDSGLQLNIRDLFAQIVMGKDTGVYEVTGRSGQFQPVIKFMPGFPLNILKPRATPNAVEIKIKGPTGGGQIVVIYKTGKIRLQGSDIDGLFAFVKKYVPGVRKTDIKYNNITAIFGTNLKFMRLGDMPKMNYEPEISPFGFLRVKSPKCTFLFTTKGVIQILGATDIDACVEWLKKYIDSVDERLIRVSPTIANVTLGKGKVARKTEGSLVTRKGTTCPKNRCPDPYSYDGKCPAGYHVRPNPQMFPCCYKTKRGTLSNVRKAYQNAGINIPNTVKKLFGNKSPSPKSPGSPSLRTSYDERGALKIGTRQCSRYTLEQLKTLAERMSISTTKLKTKAAICEAISDRFPPPEPAKFTKNFSINGANYALTKKNGKLFVNRRVPIKNHQTGTKKGAAGPRSGIRECSTILKADLVKYARALGIEASKMTKAQICGELIKRVRTGSPGSATSSGGLSNFERNLVRSIERRVGRGSPRGAPGSAASSSGLSNFERNLVRSIERRVGSPMKKLKNVNVEVM